MAENALGIQHKLKEATDNIDSCGGHAKEKDNSSKTSDSTKDGILSADSPRITNDTSTFGSLQTSGSSETSDIKDQPNTETSFIPREETSAVDPALNCEAEAKVNTSQSCESKDLIPLNETSNIVKKNSMAVDSAYINTESKSSIVTETSVDDIKTEFLLPINTLTNAEVNSNMTDTLNVDCVANSAVSLDNDQIKLTSEASTVDQSMETFTNDDESEKMDIDLASPTNGMLANAAVKEREAMQEETNSCISTLANEKLDSTEKNKFEEVESGKTAFCPNPNLTEKVATERTDKEVTSDLSTTENKTEINSSPSMHKLITDKAVEVQVSAAPTMECSFGNLEDIKMEKTKETDTTLLVSDHQSNRELGESSDCKLVEISLKINDTFLQDNAMEVENISPKLEKSIPGDLVLERSNVPSKESISNTSEYIHLESTTKTADNLQEKLGENPQAISSDKTGLDAHAQGTSSVKDAIFALNNAENMIPNDVEKKTEEIQEDSSMNSTESTLAMKKQDLTERNKFEEMESRKAAFCPNPDIIEDVVTEGTNDAITSDLLTTENKTETNSPPVHKLITDKAVEMEVQNEGTDLTLSVSDNQSNRQLGDSRDCKLVENSFENKENPGQNNAKEVGNTSSRLKESLPGDFATEIASEEVISNTSGTFILESNPETADNLHVTAITDNAKEVGNTSSRLKESLPDDFATEIASEEVISNTCGTFNLESNPETADNLHVTAITDNAMEVENTSSRLKESLPDDFATEIASEEVISNTSGTFNLESNPETADNLHVTAITDNAMEVENTSSRLEESIPDDLSTGIPSEEAVSSIGSTINLESTPKTVDILQVSFVEPKTIPSDTNCSDVKNTSTDKDAILASTSSNSSETLSKTSCDKETKIFFNVESVKENKFSIEVDKTENKTIVLTLKQMCELALPEKRDKSSIIPEALTLQSNDSASNIEPSCSTMENSEGNSSLTNEIEETEANNDDSLSGIIILNSTSLTTEQSDVSQQPENKCESEYVFGMEENNEKAMEIEQTSNLDSGSHFSEANVKTRDVPNATKPVPTKEPSFKVLKFTTDEGLVQYIKIPTHLNIPSISTIFSQSKDNLLPTQVKKVDLIAEIIEEIPCKGCKTNLTKQGMYHPCIENWCRFCQEDLESSDKFQLHTIEKHLISMKTCAFCEQEMASVQLLETHLRNHTQLRLAPSVCVACRTKFRTNEGRQQHVCSSQLLCKTCNVTLPSEERLHRHLITQHKMNQESLDTSNDHKEDSICVVDAINDELDTKLKEETQGEVVEQQQNIEINNLEDNNLNMVSNQNFVDSQSVEVQDETMQDESLEIKDLEHTNASIDLVKQTEAKAVHEAVEHMVVTVVLKEEQVAAELQVPREANQDLGLNENKNEQLVQEIEDLKEKVNVEPVKEKESSEISKTTETKQVEDGNKKLDTELNQVIAEKQEDEFKTSDNTMTTLEDEPYKECSQELIDNDIEMKEKAEEAMKLTEEKLDEDAKMVVDDTQDVALPTEENIRESNSTSDVSEPLQVTTDTIEESPNVEDMLLQQLNEIIKKSRDQNLQGEMETASQEPDNKSPLLVDAQEKQEKEIETSKIEESKHTCDICDRVFKSELDFVNHRTWHFESCAAPMNTDIPDPSPLDVSLSPESNNKVEETNDKEIDIVDCQNVHNLKDLNQEGSSNLATNVSARDLNQQKPPLSPTAETTHSQADRNSSCSKVELEKISETNTSIIAKEENGPDLDSSVSTEDLCQQTDKIGEEAVKDLNSSSQASLNVEYNQDDQESRLIVNEINQSIAKLRNAISSTETLKWGDDSSQEMDKTEMSQVASSIVVDKDLQLPGVVKKEIEKSEDQDNLNFEDISASIEQAVIDHLVQTKMAEDVEGALKAKPSSTLPCSHCRKSFLTNSSLNSHYLACNYCKFCQLEYPREFELHMVEYHSMEKTCQFCDKVFRHQKDLHSHMKTHTILEFKPFVCSKCKCEFNKSDYLQHNNCKASYESKTVTELNKFCEKCKIYFQNDSALENHIIEHHSVQDSCPICNEQFSTLIELISHLGSHKTISEIVFKCLKCQLSTTVENEFDCHQCIEESIDVDGSTASSSSVEDSMTCKLCNEHFDNDEDKLLHVCVEEKFSDVFCVTCEVAFNTRLIYEQHMIKEHSTKDTCQFCSKTFKSLAGLSGHLRIHTKVIHPLCNPFTRKFKKQSYSKPNSNIVTNNKKEDELFCKYCNVNYLKRDSFELHMMEFHSSHDVCQFCDKKFTTVTELKEHISIHTNLPHLPHCCDTCGSSFSKAAELIVHQMDPCQIFKCQSCDIVFECKEDFQTHLSERHELYCKFCLQYFKTNQELLSHMIVHTNKVGLACKICKIKFKTKVEKTMHVCSGTPLVQDNDPPKVQKRHSCHLCNKSYTSKFNLNLHLKTHVSPTVKKAIKCNHCTKTFKTAAGLKMHMNNVNKKQSNEDKVSPYKTKCKICKVQFTSIEDLKSHICDSSKLFCKYCVKNLEDQMKFEQHMIENHTSSDTCQFCNQKFKHSQSLLLHLTKHTSIKPAMLKCEYCKQKYLQGEDFESHTCNRKKEFKCCACSKDFSTLFGLASHLTKVHDIIQHLPVICGTCDSQFSNRRQLHRHPCPVGLPQDEPYISLPSHSSSSLMTEELIIKTESIWIEEGPSWTPDISFTNESSSSKGHVCPHCNVTYQRISDMIDHFCNVFYCQRCNICMTSSTSFHSHMKSHATKTSCQYCGKGFRNRPLLRKHRESHIGITSESGNKTFDCTICTITFSDKQKFESHMMTNHCSENTCQFCGKIFNKRKNYLESHLKLHTNLPYRLYYKYNKCKQCNKQFKDDVDEINHKCSKDTSKKIIEKDQKTKDDKNTECTANTTDATEKKLCLICNKKFTSKTGFEAHMMDLHEMKRKCQFCGLTTKSRPGLVNHLSVHTSIKPKSICAACDELCVESKHECKKKRKLAKVLTSPKSENESELESEPEVELAPEPPKKRTRRDELMEETEDSSSSADFEISPRSQKELLTTLKCLLCPKMFDSEDSMHIHLRNHHRVEVDSMQQLQSVKDVAKESSTSNEMSDEDLTCQHCNIRFGTASELRLHGQKARVYCEFCKKTHASQGEYEAHMLEAHPMGRTCQFCGAQFGSKTGLLLHLRKHTTLKPIFFKCFGCGGQFRTKQERLRHDCLAWSCEVCDKKCDSEEALNSHKTTHKSESKIQCEFCHNSFTDKVKLAEHVKTNHHISKLEQTETRKRTRNTKPGPASKKVKFDEEIDCFKCEGHCNKTFSSESSLKLHMKCVCQTCQKDFKSPKECDEHQVEHSNVQCTICKKKFQTEYGLSKHMVWHKKPNRKKTKPASPEVEVPPPRRTAEVPPKKIFYCETCGKGMGSNFALQMHKKCHAVYQCELCTKVFASAQKLSAHIRLHPPPVEQDEESDDEPVVILEVARPSLNQGQFVLID